jgi:hypothetical protein
MYEKRTLHEVDGYLKAVGITACVSSIHYPTSKKFIRLVDADKLKLKQATSLMSEDSDTFTLAAAKRLKDFAGEMDGEYAERAADVIAALAELNKLHARIQREKKVARFKNAAAKAYNRLNAFKFNL